LPTIAPEASAYRDYGNRVAQAKWTSPVTSRLLLEAAYGTYKSKWGGEPIPGYNTENLVRVVEQCAAGCANNGGISNLTYRSVNWAANVNWNTQWGATASWVTGSQSIKVGYQGAMLYDNRFNYTNSQFLQYRVNNGIPNQLTMSISNFGVRQRVRSDAFYAQEQWTLGRMTLQGALRYDHAWSYFPEQTVGPVRFFTTAVTYPHQTGVEGYHDIWPRGGVAYDLFGNGRTSLKVNFGRYLEAAQNMGLFTALNPTSRLSLTASREWTDGNSNFVPDCNLLNPAAQDLRASGGDLCGVNTNTNFGTQVFQSTLDPTLLSGWGVRSGDWQFGVSVQQEVLPRVAVEFGYQRRWLVNFLSTDNRARGPEDHNSFGINIPLDPRLPGGGGGVLQGLYNVTQAASTRLNDNFQTLSSRIADESQVANSFNMNVTARQRFGLTVQGGFNVIKTDSDSCALRDLIPESAATNPWCNTSSGWVSRATALGSYMVPWVDVQVAGTLRSDQGGSLAANWNAPNAATVGLNRPFAGTGGQTILVNLIEPGTLYGDRVNQFDIRVAKILRFGRTRTNIGFDVYNVMNKAAILTYNQGFVPNGTWLAPTSIQQSRFAKFSAQIDF
jgi:hypothetical protein